MNVSNVGLVYVPNDCDIAAAVKKVAAKAPVFNMVPETEVLFTATLIRYNKLRERCDFPYNLEKRGGAQWTNLVTNSHEIAGKAASYGAGQEWTAIFIVKLGFDRDYELLDRTDTAVTVEEPKLGMCMVDDGPFREFAIGKTVPADFIRIVPIKSVGRTYVCD